MTEQATANLENLYRIFTVPEAPGSTLGMIDRAIGEDVSAFLRDHIVAVERPLEEIEEDFSLPHIPEEPMFVSDYTRFVTEKLVAHSVHTAAPGFVGHMTSALPYFMLPLSRILTALNQNLVKVETSKAFTPLERQVLAMLHHLIYRREDEFYRRWIHDSGHALGAVCSGGTIANLTALWVARNRLSGPVEGFAGIARAGWGAALDHLGCSGLAILVSGRGHYSLGKAADVLGIGQDNLVRVDTDEHSRIDMAALRAAHRRLREQNILPLALVGIAGTTETGAVDPLDRMADFAGEIGCHFHVDAAWGGPTLFSATHRHLLDGIERADSVTIDAHKQMYVPMGAGMVLFRDPGALDAIEHHANYILRPGSKDLGSHTLEGSRPGMALLVHAGLSIIGRKGYELLIDTGIDRARRFAAMIGRHPDFELVTVPELNILTYRFNPSWAQDRLPDLDRERLGRVDRLLDSVTEQIQKHQREAGRSFVSRTRLPHPRRPDSDVTVFRVVLANPLTDDPVLSGVLAEQCELAGGPAIRPLLDELEATLDE